MKPSATVAWGGGLHLHGHPNGPRSVAMDTVNSPGTGAGALADVRNAWLRTGVGTFNDFYAGVYGGPLSIMPGGFSNHKPGAFYFGDFYCQKSLVSHTSMFVYLLRFDGSGQYLQGSNVGSNHFVNKSFSGRGMDFISPSGSVGIQCASLAHIVHNGVLFMCGAFSIHNQNPLTSNWTVYEDWNVKDRNIDTAGNDAGNFLARRRAYGSFVVHKKTRGGKEFRDAASNTTKFNNGTSLSGIAPDRECLHACDAVSWDDSIIYANHADIVEFPGGSGVPRFIERNNVELTSKCFESYPSSGFVNDVAVGDEELMMLTGSGVLKKILFPGQPGHNPSGHPEQGLDLEPHASGRPFGTESLVNIGTLVSDFSGPKVRTDGQMARTLGNTQEPTRSCLLKAFNKRLHAFFISASSGYYHFVCDGNPRDIDNWIDRTANLPDEFKLFDGDMYGYVDDVFNRITCMHVAKSEIGLYGTVGGSRGAGGWAIYELGTDANWTRVGQGAANSPGVGLIPYDPNGVFVSMPSGVYSSNPESIPSTDYALLKYDLFTPRNPGLKVDVDIEYTIDNGTSWHEATQFTDYVTGAALGEGKTDLSSTPDGETHEFYWAHVRDVGFNPQKNAKLRVIPKNVRAL